MQNRLFYIAIAALTTTPIHAAEPFICQATQVCPAEGDCYDSNILFDLAYLATDRVEVRTGDVAHVIALDPATMTLAWRDGWTQYQMFLMGDGGAILTRIPRLGDRFEEVEVMRVHCGPA